MKSIWRESAIPYLHSLTDEVIASHSIKLFGIGESAMEQMLHEYLINHKNPTAAPYAKDGESSLELRQRQSQKMKRKSSCSR